MKHKLGTTDRDKARIAILASQVAEWYGDDGQILIEAKHGVEFNIKPIKPTRSRQQEKYYRKWCGAFAKHSGVSPDSMHEIMLMECYGSTEIRTKNNVYRIPTRRSAGTNIDTYGELIETLLRCAAFTGFIIPAAERAA